jgi:hypothetical protein
MSHDDRQARNCLSQLYEETFARAAVCDVAEYQHTLAARKLAIDVQIVMPHSSVVRRSMVFGEVVRQVVKTTAPIH